MFTNRIVIVNWIENSTVLLSIYAKYFANIFQLKKRLQNTYVRWIKYLFEINDYI